MRRISLIFLILSLVVFVIPALGIEFIFSTGEGINLGGTPFTKSNVIATNGAGIYTPAFTSMVALLPPNVNIDALYEIDANNLVFSLEEDAVVNGYLLLKQDLILWDSSDFYLLWNGVANGLPQNVNLDAVDIISLSPLEFSFSLGEATNLAGIGQVHKSDLIHYTTASGFTGKDFDALAKAVDPQSNLDAIILVSPTQWLLSFDITGEFPVGSAVWFDKSDIINYNPTGGLPSTYFDASANGIPAQVNLDAVATYIPNYLNTYGSFTISDDSSYWFFEKYADGTDKGVLTWQSNYAGRDGVMQISQVAGEKGKLSQVFTVATAGWYTVIAKVATDIPSTSPQQKVYLYLYQLGGDYLPDVSLNEVISSANGGLGEAGVWRDITVSFYAAGTILSVQVVGINPISSGVNGNIYFDEVWVYAGAPQPVTSLTLTNANFDTDTAGWIYEKYADGSGPGTWSWLATQVGHNGVLQGYQVGGEKGKASQGLNVSNAEHDALVSVWVYSDAAAANVSQKVYLYLYSYDFSYAKVIESGNVILGSGRWTPNEWRLLQFTCKPLTVYNAVQLVGINPAGRPTQSIYFDEVSIKQD
ncbi:MAG: hypothetical protein ACE14V_05985 [bacterium]